MDNFGPSNEQTLAMFERMALIRAMEEQLGEDFKAGRLPGGVHLYIGQEAVAAGVCAHLGDQDWINSTHRGHGHFLAKGGDPKTMMAEIYGHGDGICQGMGGSMHVADLSKGILGANGIVGGGMSLSVGAALAAQMEGAGQVSVGFFGDGASNQGVLMEALNVSSLWKLPLVFICENNGFSEFSPTATVTSGQIADRALPFGIPVEMIDGNDAISVWIAAGLAIEHARAGEGPYFIEAATYRTRGHFEAEAMMITHKYREEEEIELWRGRDPIPRLARHMIENGICDQAAMAVIEARVADQVAEAAAFAQAGEPPDPAVIQGLMFDGQNP